MSGGASSYNLYGWGANGANQFGYNSGSLTYQPLTALNASASIVQITSTGFAMLALDTIGRVWAWGDNQYGSVGNFTTNQDIVSPVIVLSDVVHVAAGGRLSAAVKSDGTVWVWGQMFDGLNGVSGLTNYSSPVLLTTISAVSQVEIGITSITNLAEWILYRKTNGQVWSQGTNGSGQLGDGSTTYRSSPVQVSTISNITKVVTLKSTGTGIALQSNGNVWGWGSNTLGANGTGLLGSTLTPLQVEYYSPFPIVAGNLSNVTNIFSGTGNGFAVDSSSRLWGWGNNNTYQLGDQYYPNPAGVSRAVQISQFYDNNGNFIVGGVTVAQASGGDGCAQCVSVDGRLFSWGINDVGQAGHSVVGALQTISKPTQVDVYTDYSKVASGFRGSLGTTNSIRFQANYALLTTGEAYGAGVARNYNFTRTNTVTSPIQIGPNGSVLAVSLGTGFGIAIGADRFLYTTGLNGLGQLGTSISYSGASFSRETWWYTFLQIGTNKWKKISAGRVSGYAIREDNTLWAWGWNSKGELGDGTVTTRNSPVQVISTSLSSPVLIAGGAQFCYSVDDNGLVWSWGNNGLAELGIGSFSPGDYRVSPLPVVDNSGNQLSEVVQISAGYNNGLALKSNGEIWAWGWDAFGAFGVGLITVGTQVPYALPSTLGLYILFSGGNSPVQIASGQYHSLALSSDGTVWACGYNIFGQVGDGTTTNRSTAVQISGMSNIIAIGAGLYSSYALANDGKLWVWGQNIDTTGVGVPDRYIGYLGTANNSVTAYSSPVLVGTYPRAESFSSSGAFNIGNQVMLVKPY